MNNNNNNKIIISIEIKEFSKIKNPFCFTHQKNKSAYGLITKEEKKESWIINPKTIYGL